MHAIRMHEFGPPDRLRYEEVDDPVPAPGQVRIAVRAAGVHLLDTSIRSGASGGPFPLPELPTIPGREVAGVVDGLGDAVDPSWLGARVVAHLGRPSAGYAELAVADVGALHRLPDSVTDPAAVAMIGTGRTTMAVIDVADLDPDDVVLVTAAAGGIGSLLVQAAVELGAMVVGVAGGPAKVEQVRSQGAEVAVDYLAAPDWPAVVTDALGDRRTTVALDGVGGAIGRQALELLGPGGRLVLFGFSSGEPTPLSAGDLFQRGISATAAIGGRLMSLPGGLRPFEERALDAAATGRWSPVVECFDLADAAAAHTALEKRETMGKVVLVP